MLPGTILFFFPFHFTSWRSISYELWKWIIRKDILHKTAGNYKRLLGRSRQMLHFILKISGVLCNKWLTWRRDDLSCWEGLGAGGEGDDRGWDGWMASLTRWTWFWVNPGNWWWCAAIHGVSKSQTRLSDWTDWLTDSLKKTVLYCPEQEKL